MTCRACAAVLPPRVGPGRPFAFCDAHRPARRSYMQAWQRAHVEHIRRYHQKRSGYRPLLGASCSVCGESFRTYIGATACRRCRYLKHPDEVIR